MAESQTISLNTIGDRENFGLHRAEPAWLAGWTQGTNQAQVVNPGVDVWWRFPGVNIEKGSTILTATFKTSGVTSSNMGSLLIGAYLEDNFPLPDSVDRDGEDVPPVASGPTMVRQGSTSEYQPANVASIVQQLVNRSGWTEGNAVGLRGRHPGTPPGTRVFNNPSQHISYDAILSLSWEPPHSTKVKRGGSWIDLGETKVKRSGSWVPLGETVKL